MKTIFICEIPAATTQEKTESTTAAKPGNSTVKPQPHPTIDVADEIPEKVTGLKLLNKKGKKLVVSWKDGDMDLIKKYQVQIALNKKFTKSKKSDVTFYNRYTFKKLKKKKTYYVRVRAVGYNTKKGPWSSIKKIKIKK